ncbi:restriction endonuclease subunit S (plasmid) [Pseudoalteromonas lipolytica]|uniref:restriction endonuclease subunit S n=1 Tax=Pseudoalteromonas lipolytica TaxID=570156 RepID=UPI003BA3C790
MSTVALKDVSEIVRGVTFSKAEGSETETVGRMPVIRAGSIQRTLLVNEGQIWVEESKIKEHQLIRKNDIIMCTSSGSADLVGKCAISTNDHRVSFGAFCAGIRPNPNKVSPSYLYHFLNSPKFRNWTKNSSGANIKNIRASELGDFKLELPPLDEQKRIAAILDKADSVRRKRQQAIDLADDFLRSVFLDMFGVPQTKGWEITTVEKVAERTKGSMRTGPFGSQLLHSEFVEKGIAVLGIDNAVENKFKWGKHRFITEEKYQQLKRYTVKPDDVIITIMGTCGRCAVVPEDIPTSINTKHICCITLDKDKCLPSFLHSYFLYHPVCQKYLATNTKGAIMAGLNMGIVKGIPVPLVPLSLQVKYDSIVRRLNELTEGSSEHKENGNSLFNSLSQKAFAGEL